MRAVTFKVSGELLKDALQLPSHTRVIGAHAADDEFTNDVFWLIVEDDTVPEADLPHQCVPVATKQYVTWHWNLDGAS